MLLTHKTMPSSMQPQNHQKSSSFQSSDRVISFNSSHQAIRCIDSLFLYHTNFPVSRRLSKSFTLHPCWPVVPTTSVTGYQDLFCRERGINAFIQWLISPPTCCPCLLHLLFNCCMSTLPALQVDLKKHHSAHCLRIFHFTRYPSQLGIPPSWISSSHTSAHRKIAAVAQVHRNTIHVQLYSQHSIGHTETTFLMILYIPITHTSISHDFHTLIYSEHHRIL